MAIVKPRGTSGYEGGSFSVHSANASTRTRGINASMSQDQDGSPQLVSLIGQ